MGDKSERGRLKGTPDFEGRAFTITRKVHKDMIISAGQQMAQIVQASPVVLIIAHCRSRPDTDSGALNAFGNAERAAPG